MKKLSKDIYLVDYVNDTLKDIKKAELARLYALQKDLMTTDKLCSETGTNIVAEFEFKGDLDEVRSQLFTLIGYYENNDLTDKDRVMLMANSDRLKDHQIKERNDFYRKKSRDNVISNLEEAGKYIEALTKRKTVLHKKKECLCFSN